MNEQNKEKMGIKSAAREVTNLAVFVALVIAAQFALSFVAGVELVTVLFVAYAFVFGVRRGMLAATAFTLLRQLLFGVYLNVFLLYIVYYNLLTAIFGSLGKRIKTPLKSLWWILLVACACTLCFTLLDNVITITLYRYTQKAAKIYFISSLPVAFSQMLCTVITVGGLFLPLRKVFLFAQKR